MKDRPPVMAARPAHGRAGTGWLTALFFFASVVVEAQTRTNPELADTLRWIQAARGHTPGVVDEPLEEVAAWDGRRFDSVRRNLSRVLKDILPEQSERNDVMRRGILLHTDIAILTPELAGNFKQLPLQRPRGYSGGGQPSQPVTGGSVVMGIDGQYAGSRDVTAHWIFARILVKAIPGDPSRDSFVVEWYRATIAWFQRDYSLGLAAMHLEGARDVLPGDPRVLFYSAAMHEALATPRYQNIARSQPTWPGRPRSLDSPREELQRAERAFRDATRTDPEFAEAHLRLGRVLGLLGRHTEALAEVRRALLLTEDPVLEYFGELFSGAELEDLEQREPARQAYERAAALFPSAQAPLLALSELARRFGDRQQALAALNRLAGLPPDPYDRADPWWSYLRIQARNAGELLEDVRNRLRSGDWR